MGRKLIHTTVDSSRKSLSLNLKELWAYRDLFTILAFRDFRVRYAQTVLGFLWALLQPLVTILILNMVFGRFVNVDTGDIPHVLFTICGMISWTFFSFVMSNSGNSLITEQNMIKKVFFPRLIIPLSKAVVGLVDFTMTFIILIVAMIYFKQKPSINIVFLPLFILATIVASLSIGIWLSALTIRFRDFQHIVPFLVQLGLYITPVAYPAEFAIKTLPPWLATIYYLNPMTGIIEGFRWSVLGTAPPNMYSFISLFIVVILFISGLFYFKKLEKTMADII
jgi:lipopolysaccharide transport system permease protein